MQVTSPSTWSSVRGGGIRAGLSNRGLGNAGLVFQAHKLYEGFLFAKIPSSSPASVSVNLTVSLENYLTHQVLATQVLTIRNPSPSEPVRMRMDDGPA